ncbi:MAG: ABC transporter permease [Anaerolineae bacterium]|nr:ABC transporter permease [Anaerolineae bacterium]
MTSTVHNPSQPVTTLKTGDQPPRSPGNLRRIWRAFRRNRIAMFGLVIVVLMVFGALFAPVIAPYDPITPHYTQRLAPPGGEFLLGTDELGRDIFSRLLHGAATSLVIGFTAQAVATVIGVIVGLASGWYGGWIDDLIMRITDAFFAIPGLMFLIVWVAILEPSKESIFLALGLIGWPNDARMMRSQVLSIKDLEYVVAARAMGASPVRIMRQHLLPNAIAPVIVLASLGIAGAILAESGLSFLGLGVQIPNPSWGSMINMGGNYTMSAWWYAIFPGLAIMLTVLGFNFIGDGLCDALDPKQYE